MDSIQINSSRIQTPFTPASARISPVCKSIQNTLPPRTFRVLAPNGILSEEDADRFLGLYVEIPNFRDENSERNIYIKVGGDATIYYLDSKKQWIIGSGESRASRWGFAKSLALSPDEIEIGWRVWNKRSKRWLDLDSLHIVRAGERRGEVGADHRYEVFSGQAGPCIETVLQKGYLKVSRQKAYSCDESKRKRRRLQDRKSLSLLTKVDAEVSETDNNAHQSPRSNEPASPCSIRLKDEIRKYRSQNQREKDRLQVESHSQATSQTYSEDLASLVAASIVSLNREHSPDSDIQLPNLEAVHSSKSVLNLINTKA